MSVIIKGMEMQSGCNTCQLRDLCFDYYVCRAKKLEDGRYLDINDVVGRRHRWCPLVEIPAPHGRLIDADDLYNKFKNEYCNRNCCSSVQGKKCDHCGVSRALNIILNAPTIIEAEVSE